VSGSGFKRRRVDWSRPPWFPERPGEKGIMVGVNTPRIRACRPRSAWREGNQPWIITGTNARRTSSPLRKKDAMSPVSRLDFQSPIRARPELRGDLSGATSGAVFEAPAFVASFNDIAVMGEAIE
jgi:hypothetical protein